ncbi:hypothetical protein CPB86DRAFT_785341, partial [Serendipita vermifera]
MVFEKIWRSFSMLVDTKDMCRAEDYMDEEDVTIQTVQGSAKRMETNQIMDCFRFRLLTVCL